MKNLQMSLDFKPQTEATQKEYSLKTLLQAEKINSCATIDSGIIQGIIYLNSFPYVPISSCSQWGIKSMLLLMLYTPIDWEWQSPEKAPDIPNRNYGKTVRYRGNEWIVGNRIEIYPKAQEREIHVARMKIAWCHDFLNRFDDLEHTEASLDTYTQKRIQEARKFEMEGRKTLNKHGLENTFSQAHEWETFYQIFFQKPL